ncbi:uncharacterized protein L3040_000332 [Drepanopeziza brunnea f. sp. 'multigermtubi']|uniref:RING-type domain-containing protein n=1 Tax=Marssonina brunnea f. sp. multigermtubi (strain MB_m1) TaxID=1072389 RepID=K1WG79_MARBU|nr:uncharacterized protein MBM_09986 [Drepanopeziza brunnea f. sp. 'multigermtubi' MB_m1]EKD11861.1 hypothetical protein MBM_09986 [Drepanopeziza brunnea f. sp. 'multigermtubi' MB_m1]KAJ5054047.1 hypothetical protein L3040_000332 [Drepanopeziza brunnea f. sp. 'multigermtubi']
MCSRAVAVNEIICCGVKIDFFEDCGHTMSVADHHESCKHFEAPPTQDRKCGRLLTAAQAPPPPPRSKSMHPKPGSKLPFPQPQCRDLHRYITFVPGKCGCLFPERTDSLPLPTQGGGGGGGGGPVPERSERRALSEATIQKRRGYWLQQRTQDEDRAASTRRLEWSTRLRRRQLQEASLGVPVPDRTFVYDPDQGANDFLGAVELAFLAGDQRTCIFCSRAASSRHSRRLPCACVFHAGCLNRWFLGRKDCPACKRRFRLVKKPAAYQNGRPVWEDDDTAEFV